MNAPMGNRSSELGKGHAVETVRGPSGWLWLLMRPMVERIDRGIVAGTIDATLPDGSRRVLGGRGEGPMAVIELRSWRALLRLAMDGSAGWYEGWAKGEWASPDPVQIFALFSRNRHALAQGGRASGLSRLVKRAAHWLRRNHRGGSRRNIAFHYDLGNDFYREWLDPGMTYSSGIYARPGQSLEEAQAAKLQAMLGRVAPAETILEIGCGWGSFAELALDDGRIVHGITLSTEQKAWAEARIARMDEDKREGATFSLTDYRDVIGTYDGVVSIEMVEAVGREYWPAYLETIARVLKPGGRAAIQYISFDDALFEGYAANVDFIQRYIFPGGMLIKESEFRGIAERNGLSWTDRHAFGLSYADTLKAWRISFDAAVAEGRLPKTFDRKFIDLWRYYLMYCEGGFRGGGIDVAQVTLVKEG